MTNRDAIDPETINRMTYMLRRNRTECSSDIWDPRLSDTRVDDSGRDHRPGSAAYGARELLRDPVDQDGSPDRRNTRRRLRVGEEVVPAGLRNQGDAERGVQNRSGRDQDNNIIVYWGYQDEIHRPRDGARCWLYSSSTRSWHANY